MGIGGGSGPTEWFACKKDVDCVNCPGDGSPRNFYYAYCDKVVHNCLFNNEFLGVKLNDAPADDIDLYMVNGTQCQQLTVYKNNSHSTCFGQYWAQHHGQYAAFMNGTCPSNFSAIATQTKICEGQGGFQFRDLTTTLTTFNKA